MVRTTSQTSESLVVINIRNQNKVLLTFYIPFKLAVSFKNRALGAIIDIFRPAITKITNECFVAEIQNFRAIQTILCWWANDNTLCPKQLSLII